MNEMQQTVPIDSIHPHPNNARVGNVDVIRESLRENGWYGTVVVQQSTGHILAGNHRYEAAKAEGYKEIPVYFVDVDDLRAKKIMLADNRTSDVGKYDDEQLAQLLKEVSAGDGTLEGTGFSDRDLMKLISAVSREHIDEDEAPEPPENPITEPGDVWKMGPHRLVCGDSRSRVVVAACFNSQKANLMVTDPPYGVEYDPNWRQNALAGKNAPDGGIMNDDIADWTEALIRFPGNVAYVWHAAIFAAETVAMMKKIGFEIRAQLIWKKPSAPISRWHYNWGHEPCWYGVRKGENAAWIGDSKQQTVHEFNIPGRGGEERVGHPTQKPVALIAASIANHAGDVYDPFTGSGTVVIAATQLDRRAFCVEIDPAFCDVIVERWQQFTGGKAERLKLGLKE